MSRMTQIKNRLDNYKTWTVSQRAIFDLKTRDLKARQQQISELVEISDELAEVSDLLEKCNVTSRQHIKDEIEQLTTQALRTIYGDPYIRFTINFVSKRNQVEADFAITRENEDNPIEGDILATHGGMFADVIGFALRIIIMELLKVNGPLILDEPGKYISEQYIDNFGKFMSQMSKSFDRQIIMVTHNQRLMQFADTTIHVDQSNEITTIEVTK